MAASGLPVQVTQGRRLKREDLPGFSTATTSKQAAKRSGSEAAAGNSGTVELVVELEPEVEFDAELDVELDVEVVVEEFVTGPEGLSAA